MTTLGASVPFPETTERRAAITSSIEAATGLDDVLLERLVRAFYDHARRDESIGPLFDGIGDWEQHVANITAFWSSVGLLTGRYHGQPLPAHAKLPLEPHHFKRWLLLFEKTVTDVCTEAGAEHLMERARRIASSLEMGVAVARGHLPSRSRGAVGSVR